MTHRKIFFTDSVPKNGVRRRWRPRNYRRGVDLAREFYNPEGSGAINRWRSASLGQGESKCPLKKSGFPTKMGF
ncbi:MAG: hypothetical protein A3G40_06500 [Deltaproteobacteria bacterium RIFCSPLOWO2_12_FULL_57_22]|nr:MAG: hypothetical protein A3G40_06500 [Deltaproteobacteria bacterium RIFCSPLOWO2_12_FULL_57_22]